MAGGDPFHEGRGKERAEAPRQLPWSWGSRITDHLLSQGLRSVKPLVRGQLLDVGCGMKPYQKLFEGAVDRWVGIDFMTTPSGPSAANVFGSALRLPFASNKFDTVLSTQVLEHVSQPADLIREAYRVLKGGGHLILTAPQTNPLHEEPHDYFRYTCHGLRSLAEQAGFHVVEIRPLGGAIATIGQMIVWHSNWVRRIPGIGVTVSKGLNASIAWGALKLDRFSLVYGGGAMKDTLNWLMVARKVQP